MGIAQGVIILFVAKLQAEVEYIYIKKPSLLKGCDDAVNSIETL